MTWLLLQCRAPAATRHNTELDILAALLCLTQIVLFSQATGSAKSPSEQTQPGRCYEGTRNLRSWEGSWQVHTPPPGPRRQREMWQTQTDLHVNVPGVQTAGPGGAEVKSEWKCFRVKQKASQYCNHGGDFQLFRGKGSFYKQGTSTYMFLTGKAIQGYLKYFIC